MPLGRSEVRVPPLGIGCWAWGDRLLWGYGGAYGAGECRAAFRAATGAGVTLFDTAEIYGGGESERLLGRFSREGDPSGAAYRSRPGVPDGATPGVVVATKFAPLPWRLDRGALLRALRGSLRRLGRQQVDLYQLHFPMPLLSVEARAEGLADAVEAGLARAVGVSNYGASDLRRAHDALARRGIPLASNQVHYSLLHRSPERDGVLQACRELGVTLIAYTPLESGVLTGAYGPQRPLPRRRAGRFSGDRTLASLQPLLETLRATGEAHGGKTPGQVALNWLIAKGALPIPGAKSERQATENAGALGWRLTSQEVETLDRLSG